VPYEPNGIVFLGYGGEKMLESFKRYPRRRRKLFGGVVAMPASHIAGKGGFDDHGQKAAHG
jgi:hypothetical protein